MKSLKIFLAMVFAMQFGQVACAQQAVTDSLNGIAIRTTMDAGSVIESSEIPAFDELQQKLKPYMGKPLSMEQAREIADLISTHYYENDAPFVTAYLPEQKISGGIVQYVIVEPTLGDITVEGNEHYQAEQLVREIETRPGQKVRRSLIEEDMVWLNTPYRDVDLVLKKGRAQGSVDMVVNVRDMEYKSSWAGYDNSGNRLSGYNRYTLGYKNGTIGKRDREFVYQYTTSDSTSQYHAHYVGYTVPQHSMKSTLSMFMHVSDSDFSFNTGGLTAQSRGSGFQYGLRYARPMLIREISQRNLVLGLDFKKFNNAYDYLFFGASVAAAPDTTMDVLQLMAGVESSHTYLPDKRFPGVFWYNASLILSPGKLTAGSEDAVYAMSRAGADPAYYYLRTSAARDFISAGQWKISLKGAFQYAPEPLIGSEQIGISGSGLVRGYDAGSIMGDRGYMLSMEITTPPSRLLNGMGLVNTDKESFRGSVFADFGVVSENESGTTSRTDAASVGLGISHRLKRDWNMSAHCAWPLVDVPVNEVIYKQHNTLVHVSFNLTR